MRKLYVFNMVSLDGFFESETHELDWHHVDAEFNDFAIKQLDETGLIIFGRVTYEMMASFWSMQDALDDDPEVAERMNAIPKVVVSTTLQKAEWNNTNLVSNNIVEEITKLKGQEGKDIAVFGSAKLVSYLLNQHFVDELRIMVNPIILGNGIPLFTGIENRYSLDLESTRVFGNGNVLLNYQIEY